MRHLNKLALAGVVAASTSPAFAVASGPDLTTLTSAISAETITAGVLAIGAIMVLPRLARMGVRWLKGEVK